MLGCTEGSLVGDTVGPSVVSEEGTTEGCGVVGAAEGALGTTEGDIVGALGWQVGTVVGLDGATEDGTRVGRVVGKSKVSMTILPSMSAPPHAAASK